MAVTWVTQFQHSTAQGQHEAAVPLTSVSSNETLLRSVVWFYIDVVNPTSDVLITWQQYGVLSLLETTTGPVPPQPPDVGEAGWELRDIVYSRYDHVGFPGIFNGWYRVPGDGVVGKIDTPVMRSGGPDPLILWWNWGLPTFTGAGVEVGYYRVWSRCLIETP